MRVRAKITAVGATGVLAALATSATAQAEPGFTADPQSPAGVEYAIPLDTARGHGGGGGGGGGHPSGTTGGGGSSSGGSQSSGGSSPELFGAGIKPPSKSKPAHRSPSPAGKRSGSE